MVSSLLRWPLEPYAVSGRSFGQRIRRRLILWATHLGDDVVAAPGTPVCAIGDGEVVWSEMRLGSEAKRNWGGIVILKHQLEKYQEPTAKNQTTTNYKLQTIRQHGGPADTWRANYFYSLYGHIRDLRVKKGDRVKAGQPLGAVAAGKTPENGWWSTAHLHFAIYTGPWRDQVLPGYARPDDWLRWSPRRTRLTWWHNPQEFIPEANKLASPL